MILALLIGIVVVAAALLYLEHRYGPLDRFLDPNPRYKVTHLVAGAAVCFFLLVWPLVSHNYIALLLDVGVIGAGYEVLETVDAVLGNYGPGRLGTPGFGFSWRDVVTDVAGAAVVLVLLHVVPAILTAVR